MNKMSLIIRKSVLICMTICMVVAVGIILNRPTLLSRSIDDITTIKIYVEGKLVNFYSRSDIQGSDILAVLKEYNDGSTSLSIRDGIGQDVHYWLVIEYVNGMEDTLIVGESRGVLFRIVNSKRIVLYRDDARILYKKYFEPYVAVK